MQCAGAQVEKSVSVSVGTVRIFQPSGKQCAKSGIFTVKLCVKGQ